MRLPRVERGGAACSPRARLADEAGSFLVEVMVSALVLLIAGAGVLKMMDRGSELTRQQKLLATAGTLAQSEQETLRGYAQSKNGMTFLSNLRRSTTRSVAGVSYSITSRTDWINDDSGDSNCTTAASSADYMKLTTAVTFPVIGNRKPVTLETLIAPPARAFDEDQGSLAVRVNDRSGGPVSGLTLNLTGPATLSDATNENGCVLWGYLPAGSGYTISASRGGYRQPNGSATIAEPASVIGDQTANVDLRYDLAGGIRAEFTTQRPGDTTLRSTPLNVAEPPRQAMVEHPDAAFIPRAFTLNSMGTPLDPGPVLFPFVAPYTIYADRCAAARPQTAGAWLGSAIAPAGSTSVIATVQLPALKIRVQNNGTNQQNGYVKVTSPCGTVYSRRTLAGSPTANRGLVDDPGFPYGNLAVCVSDSAQTRKLVIPSVANTTFPATTTGVTYNIGTNNPAATTGACP